MSADPMRDTHGNGKSGTPLRTSIGDGAAGQTAQAEKRARGTETLPVERAGDAGGEKRRRTEAGGASSSQAAQEPSENTPGGSEAVVSSEASVSLQLAPRNGTGTEGVQVRAQTNLLRVQFDPQARFFRYEVKIKDHDSGQDDDGSVPKGMNREDVIRALQQRLAPQIFAQESGLASGFSPAKLKDPESGSEEDIVSLVLEVPRQNEPWRKRKFAVALRLTNRISAGAINDYLQADPNALSSDAPEIAMINEVLRALSVVSNANPSQKLPTKGRQHYCSKQKIVPPKKAHLLDKNGSEIYRGWSHSFKIIADGLSLTMALGCNVFHKSESLWDYIATFLRTSQALENFKQGQTQEVKQVDGMLRERQLEVIMTHIPTPEGQKPRPVKIHGLALEDSGEGFRVKGPANIVIPGRDHDGVVKKMRWVAKQRSAALGAGAEEQAPPSRADVIDFEGVQLALEGLDAKHALKKEPRSDEAVSQAFQSLQPREGKVDIQAMANKLLPPNTVQEYFRARWNKTLSAQSFLLEGGSKGRRTYHPLELAWVREGQLKKSTEQRPEETEAVICATADRPLDRMRHTKAMLKEAKFSEDHLLQAFGIVPALLPVDVDARILPPPRIITSEPEQRPPVEASFRRGGQWTHQRGQGRDALYKTIQTSQDGKVIGEGLEAWAIVCVDSSTTIENVRAFQALFKKAFIARNIKVEDPRGTTFVRRDQTVTDAITDAVGPTYGALQLVVVLLKEFSKPIHAEVKKAGVELVGVPTQCAIIDKFMGFRDAGIQMGYCKKIIDKVNSKLSDYRCANVQIDSTINWKVMVACDRPTLVLGIDLSSPEPNSLFPSIIAVAALLVTPDGCTCKYDVAHRKQRVNLTVGGVDTAAFESMFAEVVMAAYERHQWRDAPQRVVVYRAGVSDSQFDQLLSHEVRACENSLKSLSARMPLAQGRVWAPQLMFNVCQKNPGERFVPLDSDQSRRKDGFDGGLVLDSPAVVDPKRQEFFLQSHVAAIGTPKPVRYATLSDAFFPRLTAGQFQRFTYHLAYCWSRSTTSVSIVAPVRVAHLEAGRVLPLSLSALRNTTSGSVPLWTLRQREQEQVGWTASKCMRTCSGLSAGIEACFAGALFWGRRRQAKEDEDGHGCVAWKQKGKRN